MRYLIALPLKESETASFIGLRDKFKHLAPKWKITLGPHITLFRPSEFRLEKQQAIELFQTAPEFGAFKEKFEGFEAFLNHSNNAVYSEPNNYEKFKGLKQKYEQVASKILQDSSDVWPFHPHLTLVNRLDSDNANKLLSLLSAVDFKREFSFDSVCLYKKDKGDSDWVEIARNRLK